MLVFDLSGGAPQFILSHGVTVAPIEVVPTPNHQLFITGSGSCGGCPPYGEGQSGTGGFTPELSCDGVLKPGMNFELRVDLALALAGGVLFLAYAPADFPMGGWTLLLDPSAFISWIWYAVGPGGSATFSLDIPMDPFLIGFQAYSQAIVFDPGAPAGIATTQGVSFQFCH